MKKELVTPSTIEKICRCLHCNGNIVQRIDSYQCTNCLTTYPFVDFQLFIGGSENSLAHDQIDKFKGSIKKFSRLYSFIVEIFSPVYPGSYWEVKKYLQKIDDEQIILNLGAGNSDISRKVINLDFQPYPNVTFVSDLNNLPFQNFSIDAIVNLAVLEHVIDPSKCVSEIHRVLKPGGVAIVFVPFIQGYHASPHDFQRFTVAGLENLFCDFEIFKTKNAGPTSGLIWILSEWLSIIFSFGIPVVQKPLSLFFMVLTSPLKWIDSLLSFFPGAENIASGFTFYLKKRI